MQRTSVLAVIVAASFAAMLLLERLRPLRRTREPTLRRVARNLTTGAIALAVSLPLQLAILLPVSRWTMEHRIGLLHALNLTPSARAVLAIVLLDYTLWSWHWANHRLPLLWRFHLVHHVD